MSPARLAQLLSLSLLVAQLASAQNAPQQTDKEVEHVQAMISESKKEADDYTKAGRPNDANHPNLKWAKALWTYRGKHPGTYATTLATTEALRLLVRVDRISEMQDKANTLKLSDPAWRQVLNVLLFAALKTKDYDYFITKTEALAQRANDPEIKAKARFIQGDGLWRNGDTEKAKAVFKMVVAQFPKTAYAEEAEGNLGDIEFLNIGQTAPSIERTTIDGQPFSLAGFRGQVVVLKFWGTY